MNKENTEKLFDDFSKLYRQKDLPIDQTCMCWGFDCGNGWFDLIYELSAKLSKYDEVEAVQVKEKFGTLRFYINHGNDEVYKLIDEAEKKSGKICEICGDEGKTIGETWYITRCIKHGETWYITRCIKHKED